MDYPDFAATLGAALASAHVESGRIDDAVAC